MISRTQFITYGIPSSVTRRLCVCAKSIFSGYGPICFPIQACRNHSVEMRTRVHKFSHDIPKDLNYTYSRSLQHQHTHTLLTYYTYITYYSVNVRQRVYVCSCVWIERPRGARIAQTQPCASFFHPYLTFVCGRVRLGRLSHNKHMHKHTRVFYVIKLHVIYNAKGCTPHRAAPGLGKAANGLGVGVYVCVC